MKQSYRRVSAAVYRTMYSHDEWRQLVKLERPHVPPSLFGIIAFALDEGKNPAEMVIRELSDSTYPESYVEAYEVLFGPLDQVPLFLNSAFRFSRVTSKWRLLLGR